MIRLGYACICLDCGDLSTNRTCRLTKATPDKLLELIEQNLTGLRGVIQANIDRDILLYRISSDLIPFGSHPVNTIAWWEEFAPLLAEIGGMIRKSGMRVSLHPGQYTLLNTPDEGVWERSRRDLAYQAQILDALGMDGQHRLITHVGGAYGDRQAALQRFVARYHACPDAIRRRLVLENDDRIFNIDEVLWVHEQTGIPVVFDLLHHKVKPAPSRRSLPNILKACFATWQPQDGPPKTHLSTQDPPARPGAHAPGIDPADYMELVQAAPPGVDFDVMLECKEKDRALVALRDAIGRNEEAYRLSYARCSR